MVEEGLKTWRKRRRRKGRKKKEEEEKKERGGGGRREEGVKGKERKREKEGEREEREKRTGSRRGKGDGKRMWVCMRKEEKVDFVKWCMWVISVCVGVLTGINNNGSTCNSSRL